MRRRDRGFTLVELMVALSLAGILVAGAFQIHAVFNSQGQRQQQVADVQQSLRVSMQVIERAIRGAGAGTSNGKMVIPVNCTGTSTTFYRAQFYNSNNWPPPSAPGTYDNTALDADNDPDILRVITAADAGLNLAATGSTTTTDVRGPATSYAINDFLLFMNTTTATTSTANGCLRQITALGGSGINAKGVAFQMVNHNPGGYACVNTDATCMGLVTYPTPVRRFRNQTYFRVIPPVTAADTAKLTMMTVPLGDAPANPTWSILADDIEDMQIALMMADGRLCNDRDDPAVATPSTTCDPSLASAIRVTLVARTLSRAPGNPKSFSGGFEDSPSLAATDGRLRRSLTTEISLRN